MFDFEMTVTMPMVDNGRDLKLAFEGSGQLPFVPTEGQRLCLASLNGSAEGGVFIIPDVVFWQGSLKGEGSFAIEATAVGANWERRSGIFQPGTEKELVAIFEDTGFQFKGREYGPEPKRKGKAKWTSIDPTDEA